MFHPFGIISQSTHFGTWLPRVSWLEDLWGFSPTGGRCTCGGASPSWWGGGAVRGTTRCRRLGTKRGGELTKPLVPLLALIPWLVINAVYWRFNQWTRSSWGCTPHQRSWDSLPPFLSGLLREHRRLGPDRCGRRSRPYIKGGGRSGGLERWGKLLELRPAWSHRFLSEPRDFWARSEPR